MSRYFQAVCFVTIIFTGLWLAHADERGRYEPQGQKEVAQEGPKQMDIKRKVVFHLDWDQEERLLMTLENTKNLFKKISPHQCAVCMVANGKTVNLFRKDGATKYAVEMEDLHRQGVRFKACRNAMAKDKVDEADLLEVCGIVPAGGLEIINLQHHGFEYIKP